MMKSLLHLCAITGVFFFAGLWAMGAEPVTLTFAKPETAGISGMRPFWDRPVVLSADGAVESYSRGDILQGSRAVWASDLRWHNGLNFWIPELAKASTKPGALAFDGVHRSLLVRFPGAAEEIANALKAGATIARVELLLPYKATEKVPLGYKEPTSFINNMWDVNEPRWHAVAWALRQPWTADPAVGPTFNAAINGARYWTKYGAQDETHDRFATRFGPAEVSGKASQALDVTACLTENAFGATLGERLRRLADCGFLVKKEEYYDAHFITPGYEWAIATGGRGILIDTPTLRVTLKPGKAPSIGKLPPAADIPALAKTKSGAPTAVLPTPAEFDALKARYAFANNRPATMPDWQWKRVNELYNAHGDHVNTFPDTQEEYNRWLDMILATPPRQWEGFSAGDQLMLYYDYKDALPAYIGDHWKLYWTAELMPDRDYWELTHNQYHQMITKYRAFGSDYTDKTDDWHGDKSFYRESYCRYMSTMNFNHTAALGALLGGQFIGSEKAIADGRYGLEMFPLRLWAWNDGTQQEGIDHYYFSITMTDQKTFADYGPTTFDRLMGHSILAKSIEELATCYHPNLKRYVSTGGRTTPFYATQVQDGVQHIAHTLSQEGADTDLDQIDARQQQIRSGAINKPPIIGHDLLPRRVAMQTLKSPWAPAWMSEIFDHKPLPFEMTSTWRQWGSFRTEPKWKKSYMGTHYGLASFDYMTSPTINLQALWQRTPEKLTTATDLGQLLMRFGFNRTNFIDTFKGGTLGNMGGALAALQQKNKLLVASSPRRELSRWPVDAWKTDVKSVQTSIALFTLQDKPTWQVYVDGQEVTALPFSCKAGAHITVHDGVSYVGIIPLASTDLGRDMEVLLHEGDAPVKPQTGDNMRESLVIDNFFYHRDTPLNLAANADRLDAASGGFYVEMGDNTEYPDFLAFQRHLATIAPVQREQDGVVNLTCQSGADLLEMGFIPKGADSDNNQQTHEAIPYRRVNGKWPYLPEGIERDTPLTVLGRKGVLEKNGARLTLEPEQMGYLVTEPKTGTFLAANPLPDTTWFRCELPGGVTLEADGRIGLGFFALQPATGRLDIDYAPRPGADPATLAHCLVVSGLAKAPLTTLNGTPMKTPARSLTVAGKTVWLVPLAEGTELAKIDEAAIGAARTAAEHAFHAGAAGVASMIYEKGDHYILTKPSPGAWAFQRQWPSGVALRVVTPEGMAVTADGRLALLQMTVDTARNQVEMNAPAYLYNAENDSAKFDNKATALLITGAATPPAVICNGVRYTGPMPLVTLDGEKAYVVPLYGHTIADVLPGLAARARDTRGLLPK